MPIGSNRDSHVSLFAYLIQYTRAVVSTLDSFALDGDSSSHNISPIVGTVRGLERQESKGSASGGGSGRSKRVGAAQESKHDKEKAKHSFKGVMERMN